MSKRDEDRKGPGRAVGVWYAGRRLEIPDESEHFIMDEG